MQKHFDPKGFKAWKRKINLERAMGSGSDQFKNHNTFDPFKDKDHRPRDHGTFRATLGVIDSGEVRGQHNICNFASQDTLL